MEIFFDVCLITLLNLLQSADNLEMLFASEKISHHLSITLIVLICAWPLLLFPMIWAKPGLLAHPKFHATFGQLLDGLSPHFGILCGE